MYDSNVVSLRKRYPTFVNKELTEGLDNLPYCRVCLAQSPRASKCSLIPMRLRPKFMESRRENLKTRPRHESSFPTPK